MAKMKEHLLDKYIDQGGNVMRKITIEVDQEWFDILGVISRHQEGFVWLEVGEEGK